MPLYDYQCPSCGVFDDFRSASQASVPADCPKCGYASPRIVRAPQLLQMSAALRDAYATNERSAHEPKFSAQEPRAHRHEHSPGCSCCGRGSKMFPTKRPWMIRHLPLRAAAGVSRQRAQTH